MQRFLASSVSAFPWRRLLKKGPEAVYAALFFLILFTATYISSIWLKTSTLSTNSKPTVTNQTTILSDKHGTEGHEKPRKRIEFPLKCSVGGNQTQTCSTTHYPTGFETEDEPSSRAVCPEYFRWIHEDLRPWKVNGITREMVEKANRTAHFRLVIIKGRAYVEKLKKSIQTRDVFTIWGILQLLRKYPGRLPDLELMFDCNDRPVIRARDYRRLNMTGPPPLFRYCGDRWTEDIVFPDWSFWGWAEINIKPWEHLLKEIKKGNEKKKWIDKEPYAYWKGNPFVAKTRQDLLKCNVSETRDWNARLYVQDWIRESRQGFNQSDLASQCTHRYKIYIEGWAWSVSEKYILACDSMTLLVKPTFHDFFLRSLQPMQHYWPIRDKDKCKSIKHAVDWGNRYKQKAQTIGKAASDFIQQELKMDYVYDYMFHLLNEYSKLLKFEPRVPVGAVELCAETMACPRSGSEKKFMTQSLVKSPSQKSPCSLPPPFEPTSLRDFYGTKLNLIRRVETWEDTYWKNFTQQSQTDQPLINS
ncbi:hypothetical protein L6164_028213 [Bauhinia variegata]|uniref:Uncharacterized protein n=1 Tax=Bauhinia variegata TaxID=167791 RepID=A0ACB9LXU8_BAUVA|nr:hypothetical protein L6164_028213 [Bauhinia variegata]